MPGNCSPHSRSTSLPYALAGYGMGRRARMIRLRWTDI
jgi:hypothetical protein